MMKVDLAEVNEQILEVNKKMLNGEMPSAHLYQLPKAYMLLLHILMKN